jgi:hypothetical protein
MAYRLTSPIIAVTLALALECVAVGQGHPMPVGRAAEPMTLTEAQLNGFFAAIDELRTLGDQTWKGGDPSKPAAMAQALQVSNETAAIVHKHGFTNPSEFQRVAYNAALAYAVLKEGGKEAMAKKLDAAKAEQDKAMAKMREHMSPDQVQALAPVMEAAMKSAGAMRDVPDENIALMQKYRERMEKASKR